jgi:hypothetical protein
MPKAFFICAMKTKPKQGSAEPGRYCAMDDLTPLIRGVHGAWAEAEFLGKRALVKVLATQAVLDAIAATPGFRRIPLSVLDDPLSSLTLAQRLALRNELTDAGYTLAELNAAIPDLANATLRDVLRFALRRRRRCRWDQATQAFIFDGAVVTCKPLQQLNGEVY